MNNTIIVVLVSSTTNLLGNSSILNAQLKDTYKFPRGRNEEGFKILDPIKSGIDQALENGKCVNPTCPLGGDSQGD